MLSPHETIQKFGFFLLAALLAIAATTAAFALSGDFWLRCAAVLISIAILYFGFRISSETAVSDNRVRLKVLSFASIVLLSYLQFRQQLLSALTGFGLPVPQAPLWGDSGLDATSLAVISAVIAISGLVLWSLRTLPAMGLPENNIKDVLPKITNFDRLAILKQTLRGNLDQIDAETRWSSAHYIPLEAEVQILEGRTSGRRIVDLLKALRSDQRTRMFVVLGDPGTGKSVAMRKLARDLLAESSQSSRIPIYINLKEWRTTKPWTLCERPTVEEFYNFLYYSVLESLDFGSQAFLREGDNYRRLFEAGYFFFILDSFDEIPVVLDHDENSWLIEALSNSIVTCVLGGMNSRAVISSRLFRRPKIIDEQRSVFEIRPFSEDRVARAIRASSNDAAKLIKIVLTERPDLGVLARNPFLLHLIINHFNLTREAPLAQAQMFETFLQSNITFAREKYGFAGVADDEIYHICEDISATMFERANIGLEITDVELRKAISNPELPAVLRFLTQARIGRLGAASGAFSFSHRRFNEYFLVGRLRSGRTSVPYDSIQTDSRWRDALVLYAEIAPEHEARRLVDHGWLYTRGLKDLTIGGDRKAFVEARHALRFLVDGFRNRLEYLSHVRVELSELIRAKVEGSVDFIEKKTLVEAVGLLPAADSTGLIVETLRRYPGWIAESAAAAARYLPRIDEELAAEIFYYCVDRPGLESLKVARQLEPIYAISEAFSSVGVRLRWFIINVYKAIVCLTLVVFLSIMWNLILVYSMLIFVTTSALIGLFIEKVFPARDRQFVFGKHIRSVRDSFLAFVKIGGMGSNRTVDFDNNLATFPRSMLLYGFVFLLLLFGLELLSPIGLPLPNTLDDLVRLFTVMLLMIVGIVPVAPNMSAFVKTDVVYHNLKRLMPILILFGPFFVVLIRNDYVHDAIRISMALVMAITMVLFIIMATVIGGRMAVRLIGDFIAYRSITRLFSPTRAKIAKDFESLKTESFRIKYVDWLDRTSNDHIDVLRSEGNVWPGGIRPQVDQDAASVKLAQLDARWLDLD